jgi:hypothetical protein
MRKGSLNLTFDNFVGWLKWYDEFLEKVYHSQRVIKTSDEKIEIFEAFVPRIDAMKKKGTFVQSVLKINLGSHHLFSLRYLNAGQKGV